ncbi:MAG: hypothetical protein COY75_01380 [Nitrospirae bacterium CG_4_10_14_0_8_um_filter_41_23]|nr:hypothetical protein [Nitrospirota bacterium]OIP58570.1 MAG: hypothetical protein AUK38_07875 [Nitrospirae bacterium CG2_30_41_42]PIQ93157.1 MAG: hypothetical protein COV68_11555 [Nitrospirae bacterium CG11_big_fil_rev_8_21_14_0_20_41_14]PIV42960.1 MAG: hypothetical protein COS27_06080 [Nitrospirae bacterium CG02_land_8_20_14_3_00_41_53]PIW86946.1 MAG: hypothetical protein COZ94_07960 [Nitrospirae bacterium CG_4_8_14_3_um_filter_41_47]PIY87734.1 MAG: hypothetical protein COY75_01380 [Nitros
MPFGHCSTAALDGDNEMKIILVVIAVIVAVIGIYKKDSWPLWATLGVSGLLLIGAIVQVAVEIREAKEAAKLKYAGTLEQRSRVLLSTRENAVPKMELGDGGTIFAFTGPQGQPLFKIFDDNALIIIIDDGQVKVSTIIRNKAGTAVAELINNEWKVNKNNTFDRNYSKDAIEVKDNTGDIVLQVKVLDDRIQFQGKFYDSNGKGVALGKHESGKGGIIEMTGTRHPQLEMKIEPIFQYPSDNHLGEFRDTRR